MRTVRAGAACLAGLCLSAGAAAAGRAADEPRLTLRLRDVPLSDVVHGLFELTRQGYVVDADVAGRVDVELRGVAPEEIEADLERLGLAFSPPGLLRRVSAHGEAWVPAPTGAGHPLRLDFTRSADLREFLLLMGDVTGEEFVAPAGPLGRCVLFHDDVPLEDVLSATLASAGMEHRRQGGRVRVFRRSDPGAVLFPLTASGRHVGHVASREGEGPRARQAGIEGYALAETGLEGILGIGDSWAALMGRPNGPRAVVRAGQRFLDGVLESVGPDGIVARMETGERVELTWNAAAPGITLRAEDVRVVLDRASARLWAAEFDAAEGILRPALGRFTGPGDAAKIRAALGDLHYQWGQTLFARGALPEAVRHFEEAHELDLAERPWQAAEDLNEMGFAWTGLGEPERAVGPHQRALELSRTEGVRQEPRSFSCVRTHDRSPFLEAAALDGLAHAERMRGRLAEARRLYDEALVLWRRVGDGLGQSAALSGLGLVEHGRGRYREAVALHQKALAFSYLDPAARAAILNNLGRAQLALRRKDEAGTSFDAALALYREVASRAGQGTVLNNLGALWEARSDLARACAAYEEAAAASREADDRRGTAITVGHLERLVAQGSPADDALARCRAALAVAHPPPP